MGVFSAILTWFKTAPHLIWEINIYWLGIPTDGLPSCLFHS